MCVDCVYFLALSTEGSWEQDTTIAVSMLSTHILASHDQTLLKESSLEKWLISEFGWRRCNISLEC